MKTVSFVNMKGGVAKTTLAVNVADALVRRHDANVLLIDVDPQFNATQCLVSPEEYVAKRGDGAHTILHLFEEAPAPKVSLASGVRVKEPVGLADIKPWEIKEGLDIIAGDLELYRIDMGAGLGREFRLRNYLNSARVKDRYDFVIIDTPPTPSAWMTSSLLASSHFVVPVRPDPLSRTGIDLLRGVINRCTGNYGHKLSCLGVVLTIAEEHTVVFRDTVEFLDSSPYWKGQRMRRALPKRTAIAKGQGEQKLILDLQEPESKLAIAEITAEFLERLANV